MESIKVVIEIDENLKKFCNAEQTSLSAVFFLSSVKKSLNSVTEKGWSEAEASNLYSGLFGCVLEKLKSDVQTNIHIVMSQASQNQLSESQLKEFMFNIISDAHIFTKTYQSDTLLNSVTKERLEKYKDEVHSLFEPYLTKKPKGGCYIATMAYGDYDHPQVLILRKFRDEVLDKSALGKWFIKTYYHYSPLLVEKLKNQRIINIVIRKALNQFIKIIK